MSLTLGIKQKAKDLGFELVGISPVVPVPELAFYRDWIEAGYAGQMDYLKRNTDKKQDIRRVVAEAQSVIVCGKIYHTGHPLSIDLKGKDKGWISRYAWGDDYHDALQAQLFELIDFVKSESEDEVIARPYVDTGPVIDRVYAKYAGIGWFGKNTCLIEQNLGSWFFVGEIITSLQLDYDGPAPDRCGTCTRCIDACPTDAILEPYLLDSRLCISYLTIELKGDIPVSLREGIGNHVFGCDICQDVCPWNGKAASTDDSTFQPREGLVNPDLMALASMSAEQFRDKFKGSPIKRTKFAGFLRNVAVAMGNAGETKFLPVLHELCQNEDPMIARHAEWAIEKINAKIPMGVQ